MRLKQVILEKFRGYQHSTRIPISDSLTGFIGKNEAGKSTVLEALEIFFNNDQVKIERDDLNINAPDNLIRIGCVFDELPKQIIVDKNVPTSFEDEFLTNEEGCLEVIKEYKCLKSVGKPTVYLNVHHPKNRECANLHSMKISELKKLGKKLGVEDTVEDNRVSSQWRQAIWNHFENLDLEERLLDVSQLGKDSKSIYEKIESSFPMFALFRSDRPSNDDDPEAKDPMQAAVKKALKEYESEIKSIQNDVKAKVEDVAKRTLEKLNEMNEDLANDLVPKFKRKPKWSFNFTIDSDKGIPLNKRGSGVRRLILLNFFRAEAEKEQSEEGKANIIYAIEEPETSQHPDHQLMLMEALLELAENDNCQILLTTHVPALAGTIPVEGLRYITENEEKDVIIEKGSDEVLEKISKSLGVLPPKEVATSRAIIMVEGHSDVLFLNHASEQFSEDGYCEETLRDKSIAIIPTGGCDNLRQWITRKTADDLGMEWAIMLDSDLGDTQANKKNKKTIRTAKHHGKKAYLLKKREIENYIHPQHVNSKIEGEVEYGDTDDAKHIISRAAGIKKSKVIETFWTEMDADQILEMDQYDQEEEKHELLEIVNDFLTIVE